MALVLIVDDSPTELHLFQSMLEKSGHKTLVAENGEEGVRMATEEKPDCILMDVVMPGMNGFEATRKLSKDPKTESIPIIMITSKDQETDKIWGIRQGAAEYLVKPVQKKDLITLIDTVMSD